MERARGGGGDVVYENESLGHDAWFRYETHEGRPLREGGGVGEGKLNITITNDVVRYIVTTHVEVYYMIWCMISRITNNVVWYNVSIHRRTFHDTSCKIH